MAVAPKRETETAMQWWSQLTATNIGHSKGYVRCKEATNQNHDTFGDNCISPCSALTALPTRLLASAARRTATSTTGATTPTACPTATPSPSSDSSAPQSTNSRPTLSPGGTSVAQLQLHFFVIMRFRPRHPHRHPVVAPSVFSKLKRSLLRRNKFSCRRA